MSTSALQIADSDNQDTLTEALRRDDDYWREKAYACARGSYQRDLLGEREYWSGSSLRGLARTYGARYARSRSGLLGRIFDAGIPHTFAACHRGKIELLFGQAADLYREAARRCGDTPDLTQRRALRALGQALSDLDGDAVLTALTNVLSASQF